MVRLPLAALIAVSAMVLLLIVASPAHALSPVNAVFVANSQSNTVSIIDTSTGNVVGTVTGTGAYPRVAMLGPGGSTLYVGCYDASEIDIVSLVDLQITKRIAMPGRVVDIAISPDGAYLYAGLSTHAVTKIDLRTNQIVGTLSVGGSSEAIQSLDISADGQYLWCAGYPDVAIYTLYTNGPSTPILVHTTTAIPGWPASIVYAPGQSGNPDAVYASFQGGVNRLVKIDPTDYSIDYNITTSASSPWMLAYQPGYLYVSTPGGIIQVYDANLNFQANITTGTASVQGIALPSWGTTGYASLGSYGRVTMFNTTAPRAVIGNTNTGANPLRVTYGQISPEASVSLTAQVVKFTVHTAFYMQYYSNVSITVLQNGNVIASGITDSTGSWSTVLYPTRQYTVLYNRTAGQINGSVDIDATRTEYGITAGIWTSNPSGWYSTNSSQTTGSGSATQDVRFIVTGYMSGNNLIVNCTYTDASLGTTFINFTIYKRNMSALDRYDLVAYQVFNQNNATCNLTVAAAAGQDFTISYNSTNVYYGALNGSTSQHIKGPKKTIIPGIPYWVYNWLAIIIIMSLFGLASRLNAGFACVAATIAALFLWEFWGWLDGVATGVTITVSFLLSGMLVWLQKKKREI